MKKIHPEMGEPALPLTLENTAVTPLLWGFDPLELCSCFSPLCHLQPTLINILYVFLCFSASNLTHYFSPAAIANNPTRALLLIGAILLAYWFLSLFLGFFFYLLHMLFGRFFWIARVALFTLSCVYILQKYEGDPEHAVLPLCFVVAVYFMTGPVGFYWRRNSNSSLEEKMDHLDSQIRLLNIRLSRVIENLDRGSEQ